MVVNHQIKSQVFDTSFLGDKREAHALYNRLKQLFYDEVLKVIEDCFDQYDQEDYSLVMETLELDLGEIGYDEIDTRFPMLVKEILKEKLTDIFIHKRGVYIKRKHLVSSEKLVVGFLENGYLESTSAGVVDESLQESIAAGNISNILNLVKQNYRARSRFLRRVSKEEIIKIIQLISPNSFDYIKAFYSQLTDKKLPSHTSGNTSPDQSIQLLHIIFDYMISVGDSYFNTKEFTKRVINCIAIKYNISVIGLIDFLLKNVEETNESYRSTLLQILKEIGGNLIGNQQAIGRSDELNKYNLEYSFFSQLTDGNLKTLFKNTDAELVRFVIYHHGEKLIIELLRLKHKAKFFDLFVRKFDRSEVNHLIARIEPGGASSIFRLHGALFDFQDASRFVNDSSANFQQNIMKLTLLILIVDRGSRFNQKVFVTNLIRQTASHYNSSYQELLLSLNQACLQWSKFMPNAGQFVSIIKELYQESNHKHDGILAKKLKKRDDKLNVLNELNLIKVLNNKNLYDSISSWRLQYLLNEFFKSSISKGLWKDFWNALSNLENLYKFFIAVPSPHFQRMIANINVDDSIVKAHNLMSNALTRLFSPSHKSYLVTLDVKLFELLLQNRIKSIHQSDLLTRLLENILPVIPVSARSFLSVLNEEQLPAELKNVIVTNQSKLVSREGSATPSDFKNELLNLFRGVSDNFSAVGYSGIVQLISDISSINRGMLVDVFGQLTIAEMNGLIDRSDDDTIDSMIKIVEQEHHYNFSNFLRISSERLLEENFKNYDRTMRSFRKIILSSIYRKSDFKIRKLVNKLYATIRNNEADCLFSVPTFSLPVYGNIHNTIEALETAVSENPVVPTDQESEDKEVLKKLIKLEKESAHEPIEDPLYLHNAGLVLLHPYLGHLFDRVGLFEDGDFRSLRARKEAAIYLNYILLNDEKYDEENLTLNKILCGLNIDEIIDFDIELTDVMKDTAVSMLDAFIAHWTKISNSTHDGVRGGWLWREGKLLVKEDSFELTVEQKAYDILMDQLPFSLSHITYSWMKKPLYVIWR